MVALPKNVVFILNLISTAIKKRATTTSPGILNIIRAKNHHSMMLFAKMSIEKQIIIKKSPTGSKTMPSLVTWFNFLANIPSNKSVRQTSAAKMNITIRNLKCPSVTLSNPNMAISRGTNKNLIDIRNFASY